MKPTKLPDEDVWCGNRKVLQQGSLSAEITLALLNSPP